MTEQRAWQGKLRAAVRRPVTPLAVFALLAAAGMLHKSAIFDEAALLASGARYLRTGENAFNAENPPLVKAIYALPTLLLAGKGVPPLPESARYAYDMMVQVEYGNAFLYGQPHPGTVLFGCRLMCVAVACLLGWVLFTVSLRIWSRNTAVAALWIFALSPNLIAHGRLITLDTACSLAIFGTALLALRLLDRGRWVDAMWFGLALGGALLTKFTAVLLLPLTVVQVFAYVCWQRKWSVLPKRVAQFIAGGLVAILVINAMYGFAGFGSSLSSQPYRSPMVRGLQALPVIGDLPVPMPVPYIRGFDIVANNNRPGFPNIFLGKLYPKGGSWWYYYLVVMALKVPIPLLLALGFGLGTLVRRRDDWGRVAVLAIPPALMFANFSFIAYRQLGLRYILPLWPFFLLAIGSGLEVLRGHWQRPAIRAGCVSLAAWYALGTVLAHPDYLSYFNEAAGGAKRGWRYLAVSNTDWGQDLPALARWQRRMKRPSMFVLYYGSAPLAPYGVEAQEWATDPLPPFLAISVTNYYLWRDVPLVRFLRDHRVPVAYAGGSIHIYRLDQSVVEEMVQRAQIRQSPDQREGSPSPTEP
ncbi:MAG: hypothetical protein HN742_34265 [Lentisphaerae bacterium]|jgi:4-amino-4-deoxy-L-arabinose transferase-like glycosyltransferase|nr:hypothetical protein [Lentisphaerota bacterium]MBT7846988.1 hypothetical protein [Lentisphaerota bacterium]